MRACLACLIVSVDTLSTRAHTRKHTGKCATSTGESEVPSFIRGWKHSTSTAGDETTALGAVPLPPTAMALTTVPDLSTSIPSLHTGDAGVGSAQFTARCYRSIACKTMWTGAIFAKFNHYRSAGARDLAPDPSVVQCTSSEPESLNVTTVLGLQTCVTKSFS
jgi:hypothetical protein